MSKAFTKEQDDAVEEEDLDEPDALPAGTRNLVTPGGLAELQTELRHLKRVERPKVVEVVSWAAGNGDRSENGDYIYGKKRLREIDRRMRYLLKRLDNAEVVDPARQQALEQVFFGATVTYVEGEDDAEKTIRLVGIDEAEIESGKVSWVSPIARAVLKSRIGDTIEMRAPGGTRTIEIVGVSYGDGSR